MKLIVSTLLVLAALVQADICRQLCDSLAECRQHGQGSYCKSNKNPMVCKGLYWKDSAKTQLCDRRSFRFPAFNSRCPTDRPVLCSSLKEPALLRPVPSKTTSSGGPATPDTTAYVRVPDGIYRGRYLRFTLVADVDGLAMTCDVLVTLKVPLIGDRVRFRGRGLSWTMSFDGKKMKLHDTPELIKFRRSLPGVPDKPLIIYYDAPNEILHAPANGRHWIKAVRHTPGERPVPAWTSTTLAPSTTTSHLTTAEPVEIRVPDGRYQGAFRRFTVRVDVDAVKMTFDLSFLLYIPFLGEVAVAGGVGLSFTMSADGGEVHITDTQMIQEFRRSIRGLPDRPLIIQYDASRERLVYRVWSNKGCIEMIKDD